ncbi:unnamed protein product [Blepharisma stoltei]|uniref:Uncharacterized protein n=1 Tax=Blepharisma stoltei TaxID=1481888 RepID=A0AAU9JG74_9CILI|nr:unnamed protein product [Blepharisma stoltei]
MELFILENWNKNSLGPGFGLQLFTDGSQYEGYLIKNKANIKGRLVRVNWDVYEGERKNDKACGYGIYAYICGARYELTEKLMNKMTQGLSISLMDENIMESI